MFSFARQVQNFCDHAKNSSARLARIDPPRFEDNEASLEELKTRVVKTLDFIKTLDRDAIDGGASREIILPIGPNKARMQGADYLLHFLAELLLPPHYRLRPAALCRRRYGKRDFSARSRLHSGLRSCLSNEVNKRMSIERIDVGPRMSAAVVHGDTVYLAGQVAKNAAGKSVAEQTREILEIIDGLLARAGTGKSLLLSTTIYLADIKTFAEMNSVWDAWVAQGATPARATVEAKLAAPQYTVEIACIAAKS